MRTLGRMRCLPSPHLRSSVPVGEGLAPPADSRRACIFAPSRRGRRPRRPAVGRLRRVTQTWKRSVPPQGPPEASAPAGALPHPRAAPENGQKNRRPAASDGLAVGIGSKSTCIPEKQAKKEMTLDCSGFHQPKPPLFAAKGHFSEFLVSNILVTSLSTDLFAAVSSRDSAPGFHCGFSTPSLKRESCDRRSVPAA